MHVLAAGGSGDIVLIYVGGSVERCSNYMDWHVPWYAAQSARNLLKVESSSDRVGTPSVPKFKISSSSTHHKLTRKRGEGVGTDQTRTVEGFQPGRQYQDHPPS